MTGACIMLVLGIIASIVFFAIEYLFDMCIKKKHTRKRSYSHTTPNDTIAKTLGTNAVLTAKDLDHDMTNVSN